MRKFTNTRGIKSVPEMKVFAQEFLQTILPELIQKQKAGNLSPMGAPADALVVCLSGDLGSGKTTFTQQVAEIFNVRELVTSPTFILQKKYNIGRSGDSSDVSNSVDANEFLKLFKNISQIIHMDMYRIENVKELDSLGFYELIKDQKNLVILEWPERIIEATPPDAVWLSFEFVDETTRRVQW